MKPIFKSLSSSSIVLALCIFTSVLAHGKKQGVFFLVRHAEKINQTSNSGLTATGHKRARALAELIKSANINQLHSTNYVRTKKTAEPSAKELSLPVKIYDPNKLSEFAKGLKRSGGRHLVVGHSNTTPELATLLGGVAGAPIVEASEYDRLYIITIAPNGKTSTVVLRYGPQTPSVGHPDGPSH